MTTFTHGPDIQLEFKPSHFFQPFTIKSCKTYNSTRTLENPASQALVSLQGHDFDDKAPVEVRGKRILDVLGLHDICKVRVRDGKGKQWVDVKGMIRNISEQLTDPQGKPGRNVQISLAGIGQALVDYQIFWHPHIAARSNLGGMGYLIRSKGRPPKGRPDEVLHQLADTFFNDDYIFRLADQTPINQAIFRNFGIITDGMAIIALSAMGMEGPLWQTLKRFSDAPWNELFVDIPHELNNPTSQALGDVPQFSYDNIHLYLRKTPYEREDWDRLAQKGSGWGFEYREEDRMEPGEMLARNVDKVYNFFWCPAKAVFAGKDQLAMVYNQSNGKLPIIDEDSVRKYGLRRLEQQTEYVQIANSAAAKQGVIPAADRVRMQTTALKWSDLLVDRTKRIARWNGYDKFEEGTIGTRGRIGADYNHGARIGGVITRQRDGKQFYITGIQQNWSHPGPHTTTLTVSRGHDPADYQAWWAKRLAIIGV